MRLKLNKTLILLLFLFASSYSFFMLQQLPAKTLVQWLPKNMLQRSNIRLTGITGTLWNGQLAKLRLNGFGLSNLTWQLHAWPLVLGDVSLGVKFRQTGAFGKGEITTDFGAEKIVMSSVQGGFPATQLMPLFYGFPIALDGQLTADIKKATIQKGQQLSLQGELLWREAALSAPPQILFGDLQIKMQAKDKGTVMSVQDQGGPLQLQGKITLQGNGAYETNVMVATRSSASKALAQSISILGVRDAQGNVQIKYKGKLPNWQ